MRTQYQYHLPPHLLATEPASPRDSSKLMVYDTATDTITIDRFYRIAKYLPKNSFLVLNQTAVAPARVSLHRENGGAVTVLFLVNEPRGNGVIRGMVDRKLVIGEKVYVKEALKNTFSRVNGDKLAQHFVVPATAGSTKCLRSASPKNSRKGIFQSFPNPKHAFQVKAQDANIFSFQLNFPDHELPRLFSRYGTMPIPPYLKGSKLSEKERRRKYQTTFCSPPVCHSDPFGFAQGVHESRNPFLSSIAAPTASLHFTNRVFKSLQHRGIPHYCVTLHVGRGTFAPVTDEQIKKRRLHDEWYSVDPKTVEAIRQLKAQGKKLVAVGTTTVRTLESMGERDSSALPYQNAGSVGMTQGKTDLFITPPYDFKAVDILITNFHLPNSSLMMLVEAFLQHKKARRHLIDLYQLAIDNNFRFYSFGDCLLLL